MVHSLNWLAREKNQNIGDARNERHQYKYYEQQTQATAGKHHAETAREIKSRHHVKTTICMNANKSFVRIACQCVRIQIIVSRQD